MATAAVGSPQEQISAHKPTPTQAVAWLGGRSGSVDLRLAMATAAVGSPQEQISAHKPTPTQASDPTQEDAPIATLVSNASTISLATTLRPPARPSASIQLRI